MSDRASTFNQLRLIMCSGWIVEHVDIIIDNVILLLGPWVFKNRCKACDSSPNMRLHAQWIQWQHNIEATLDSETVKSLKPRKCGLRATS